VIFVSRGLNIRFSIYVKVRNNSSGPSGQEANTLETAFTPISALIGGGLIGLASVLLMAGNGRIAGISGIVARLLPPFTDRFALPQSVLFVLGLLLAYPLYSWFAGGSPAQVMSDNPALLAMAGLLVGFGAVWGGGCTSGHGVCGISRLSARSIVATCTFITTGVIAVFVLRHVIGV
jgi:uncharacterized membrane protein YedE/YeeE